MRGIYEIRRADYPPVDDEGNDVPFGDVHVLNPEGQSAKVYLHTGRCPHPEIEALGAKLLGDSWRKAYRGMTTVAKGYAFDAEWDDTDSDGEPIVKRGRRKDRGSKPLRRDYLVPHAFHARETAMEQAELDKETGA